MSFEGVQPLRPCAADLIHPVGNLGQSVRFDPVQAPLGISAPVHQPSLTKDAQMAGYRRARDREVGGQLTGAPLAAREQLENLATSVVGERIEERSRMLHGCTVAAVLRRAQATDTAHRVLFARRLAPTLEVPPSSSCRRTPRCADSAVTRAEDRHHVPRCDAAFGQQHHGVVQEIGRLLGHALPRRVTLGA